MIYGILSDYFTLGHMDSALFYSVFVVGTVVVAALAHAFIRSYLFASLATGVVVPAFVVGLDSLQRGFVDSWASIAAITSGAAALATALIVGIPFWQRRRKVAKPHVA